MRNRRNRANCWSADVPSAGSLRSFDVQCSSSSALAIWPQSLLRKFDRKQKEGPRSGRPQAGDCVSLNREEPAAADYGEGREAAAPTREPLPGRLRSDFAWTFSGNAIYAATQWAILSAVAKLGGANMLGEYALALAATAPAIMLAHLNLRSVLATDMEQRHRFGEYLAVRLRVTAAGLVAICILAFFATRSAALAAVIVLLGAAQSAETISDLYYGALQRRGQMKEIALSTIARGSVSLAALVAALWLTRSLAWAVAALMLGRVVVLLAYDRPKGSAGECLSRSGWRMEWTIMQTALPLGIVLMLVSLNTNLPRYAIQYALGTRELGAFAAVASFITIGSTVANALGQAATPRLARHFSQRRGADFRHVVTQLVAWVLALGAAGILASILLGRLVLRLIYRPGYELYAGLLTAVMAAAVPVYLAIILGYVITSVRAFTAQIPLFCLVAATCGAASWILIPKLGLPGAVIAVAAAACVQIAGELIILIRGFHTMEAAQ